jgi:hypothetical protein
VPCLTLWNCTFQGVEDMVFQDSMQLLRNEEFFGSVIEYFYETPWAAGRLIAQDKGQHDLCMRIYSFLDWVLSHGYETNLPSEESDKQYYHEMAKRGLSEEDIDWCEDAEWTIVTSDGQEHPAYSLSFYVDGFIQWRW